MRKISAVIPAYNEEQNIGNVLEKTKLYVDDIIVVDDGSTDNTFQEAKQHGATVLRHIVNLGKGSALNTGVSYAFSNGSDVVVLLDADNQHNPGDIPRFIEEIDKGADIVFGYRKGGRPMPRVLKLGNFGLSRLISIVSGVNLKDTQCGFRALTRGAYKKIRWNAPDYAAESEMVLNAGKNRLKYSEIEIDMIYKDKFKGTTVIDGFKIFLNTLICSLKRSK